MRANYIGLIILVLAFAGVVTAYVRTERAGRSTVRSVPAVQRRGLQVICADCQPEDGEPVIRTFLTSHGRCSRCGGDAYVLATHAPRPLPWETAPPAPLEVVSLNRSLDHIGVEMARERRREIARENLRRAIRGQL